MSRPSKFGDKKPEVLRFVRGLSRDHFKNGDKLSLDKIAKRLRAEFKFLPPPPPKPAKKGDKKKTDALKLVVYRLCNKNGIWFGDPERMPSRMETAAPKKAKKA